MLPCTPAHSRAHTHASECYFCNMCDSLAGRAVPVTPGTPGCLPHTSTRSSTAWPLHPARLDAHLPAPVVCVQIVEGVGLQKGYSLRPHTCACPKQNPHSQTYSFTLHMSASQHSTTASCAPAGALCHSTPCTHTHTLTYKHELTTHHP